MKIKETWEDISFKEYVEFTNIENSENNFTDLVNKIGALYSLPVNEVKKMDLTTINNITGALSFLSKIEGEPRFAFTYQGEVFNILQNFGADASIGQLADEEFVQNNIQGLSKIPYLIAIYCQNRKDYDSTKMFELAEKFKGLSMKDIYDLNAFFLLRKKLSQQSFQLFIQEMKEILKKELNKLEIENSKKYTGGMRQFLKYSLIKRYLKLMKQVASQ